MPTSRVRVAVRHEFQVGKRADFAALLRGVQADFHAAGLSDYVVHFSMVEGSQNKISAVERVLKRFPELRPFDFSAQPWAGAQVERQIGNEFPSPRLSELADVSALLAIAPGVPKSFPFFSMSVRFMHPLFGAETPDRAPWNATPGVTVANRWGRTGRKVSIAGVVVQEAERQGAALPALPDAVRAVLDGGGKQATTRLMLLPGQNDDTVAAVHALTAEWQKGMAEVVERAGLPHAIVEDGDRPTLQSTGPRKPALVAAMKPLGYDCRAGGMFVLNCSRWTSGNLLARLNCDFGSTGNHVNGFYLVEGLGFKSMLQLPVSAHSAGRNPHWIVDEDRWLRIAENWGALVAELDRRFLPAVEAVAGPSPAWFPEWGAW